MKQVSMLATLAIALAAVVAGCSTDSDDPGASGDTGRVSFSVLVGDEDVTSVTFDIACEGGLNLSGEFNVNDGQDPPIWATVMDLPVGDCSVTLTALSANGEPLCSGSEDFTVIADETVKVNVVLVCEGDGEELLGNVDIDATFVFVDGNACPRLHFLNAVPDEVPAEGSAVTVLVSDRDGDTLTTALTATGGSFADPAAQSTTYTCDGATGAQTISVTVSDGDEPCNKSKSFDVTCPGTNSCDGVTCEDDGNECTSSECNPSTGQCETTNLEGTMCGGEVDVAMNGGLEEGTLNGWLTEFCDGSSPDSRGLCELSDMANTGNFAVRVFNDTPASASVLKQANKFPVSPGDPITITFAAKGATAAGGVVFAEFFSELAGGGTSKNEILGGGPLPLSDQYQFFTFNTVAGPDVSGGVTLQFAVVTGGDPSSSSELFADDVSITVQGGEPGMCSGGECVPAAECTTAADCPDDGNECTDPVCNAGTCGVSNNTNVCDGGAGTCDGQGNCVPDAECTTAADCPDDGNECTDAVCAAGACGTSNNTNVCDGGAGTCNAGVCEPNGGSVILYEQNFEGLDQADPFALALDGWDVFGNVFEADGTTFFRAFGPFDAPNGGPGFSAIASGQGGPPQGEQQLVNYSDYNNGVDQAAGRRTEALVFQERIITADEVGKTITFAFDAKRGDINDPAAENCINTPNPPCDSTAQAFVKTFIVPAFIQTNLETLDTTNLPVTWDRYTITLGPIVPELEGQLLQVGFSATAQNFEPSGMLYDNVLLSAE